MKTKEVMDGLITLEEAIKFLELPCNSLSPAGKIEMILDLLHPKTDEEILAEAIKFLELNDG